MLLVRLWNYLRGYVIIMAKGPFPERFINICASKRIFLWDVKPRADGWMNLKTSIRGFKLLRPAARKSKTSVKLSAKRGIPFLLRRIRRRKAFVAGLLVFLILINLLTSFIWVVEIEGCAVLTTEEVTSELASLGVKPGVCKYRVNTNEAAVGMMLAMKDLAWISVEIVGTKAKVILKEAVKPPELIDLDTPCDIVAIRDGIVKNIVVKQGNATVIQGDTVKKGQVLISGMTPPTRKDAAPSYSHAIGSIKARTWYERTADIEYKSRQKVKTGKSSCSLKLVLFGNQIGIWGTRAPFAEYETALTERMITLGKDTVLPFGYISTRYAELETREIEIAPETALENAVTNAMNGLAAVIPAEAEIIMQDVYHSGTGDDERPVSVRIVIECLEEIGIQEKVTMGNENDNTNETGGE